MILVDTTPLVALCDPRDRLNRRALEDLDRLARGPFVICLPVITAASFHLRHPIQRQRLRRFLSEFPVGRPAPDDDPAVWLEVFDWLARYEEHEPDWADGYLAILSARHHRARLWTYDGEFRSTWRRPDGSRIPLAVS